MTYTFNTLNVSADAEAAPRSGIARFGHEVALVLGLAQPYLRGGSVAYQGVGTNLVLNLHGHLGSEAVNRAVNMRLEVHAVVVNVGEAFLALRHVVVAEGAAVGALSVSLNCNKA